MYLYYNLNLFKMLYYSKYILHVYKYLEQYTYYSILLYINNEDFFANADYKCTTRKMVVECLQRLSSDHVS